MVSFSSIALLSLATVGTLAGPIFRGTGLFGHNSQCLSAADAQQVADNYAELIRAYSDELADAALATDFTDFSEGVNTLINTCPQGAAAQTLPLLSASFTNRQQFEIGQSQQPAINFKQLAIWYDCDSVIIRWETTNTAPIPSPRPVVGLIVMEVEKAPAGNKYPFIINTVYSEFDSGAWLQNLEEWGICKDPSPSSPPIAIPASSAAPSATPASAAPSGSAAPAITAAPAASSSP